MHRSKTHAARIKILTIFELSPFLFDSSRV
jgi:hypothetical protein